MKHGRTQARSTGIDMKRTGYLTFTWLLWLALPLTALRYWTVWDQLPARMATHFDVNGHANGWMSREASLAFALGLTAFMLVIFTVIPYLASRKRSTSAAFCWSCVAFAYVIVGFIFYVNNSLIEYNLTGRQIAVAPVLLVAPIAVVVLTVLFLAGQRGKPLAAAPGIAEETHGSRAWAMVFLLLTVPQIMILSVARVPAAQIGVGLICLLFGVIALHAWTGFHYRFTPAGVEISTLGLRLQSVPLAAIRHYSVERWHVLRGYGIRGIGGTRAYVWGNNVVHIATDQGDVFLGHDDPARLVRDLDAIKGFAHS
jgi:hypothetical protein